MSPRGVHPDEVLVVADGTCLMPPLVSNQRVFTACLISIVLLSGDFCSLLWLSGDGGE